jgi:membrane-associated phospholipid phosphatase
MLFAIGAVGLTPHDRAIYRFIEANQLPGDFRRLIQLCEIFAHGSGFVIIVLGIWTLAPDLRRFLPRLVAAYLMTGLVTNVVKLVVWRYRPSVLLNVEQQNTEGFLGLIWDQPNALSVFNWEYLTQSFPSGHSASAVTLAMSMSILMPRGRYLFFGLAVLACVQRTLFSAHWPSDVFAGVAIGIWVTAIGYFTPLGDGCFAWFERMPGLRSNRDDGGASLLR